MKRVTLSLIAGALVAWSALAQDSVMVCQRDADGSCTWVQQDASGSQDWLEPEPGTPYAGNSSDAFKAPQTVFLEWQNEQAAADPMINALGSCARKAEHARNRFALAMGSNDFNRLLATYNWRGKTDADAESLISRLSVLSAAGQWQKTVVSSFEEIEEMEKPPVHWRWNDEIAPVNFKMVKVQGCWFVEFVSPPGQSVVLQRRKSSQPPRHERVNPEPGVFDF